MEQIVMLFFGVSFLVQFEKKPKSLQGRLVILRIRK